jgi:hypothetical protein
VPPGCREGRGRCCQSDQASANEPTRSRNIAIAGEKFRHCDDAANSPTGSQFLRSTPGNRCQSPIRSHFVGTSTLQYSFLTTKPPIAARQTERSSAMLLRSLAILALALGVAAADASEFVPGTVTQVTGTVADFHSNRSFWLDVDGQRVLVYGTIAQNARLIKGQRIRIEASVSDDFIKVADVELQARAIETVRTRRPVTAAAMP